jgi:hypothetical protein
MDKRGMVAGALVLMGALAGCGGDKGASASEAKEADDYQITQIAVQWHEAASTKDVELAMSLFADDAVLTAGGKTSSGKEEIRRFLSAQAAPFQPQNRWTSLTHTPNIRHTLSGSRGTLFFECHYLDLNTRQIANSVSADTRVVRQGNKWVFKDMVTGNAILG